MRGSRHDCELISFAKKDLIVERDMDGDNTITYNYKVYQDIAKSSGLRFLRCL